MAIKTYEPEPIAVYDGITGRVKYTLRSTVYRGWSRIVEVTEQVAVDICVKLYLKDNKYYVTLFHQKQHFGTFVIPQDNFPDITVADVTVVFNNLLEQAHQDYVFHPFTDLARALEASDDDNQ